MPRFVLLAAALLLQGCYLSHDCTPADEWPEAGLCMQEIVVPVGLYTDPSPMANLPDGALHRADNLVLRRPGIVEPRPGLISYTDAETISGVYYYGLFSYDSELFAALYDSTGGLDLGSPEFQFRRITSTNTKVTYGGADIQFTAEQIRAAEAQGSLFFTTNSGVLRIDSGTDTTALRSGMPQSHVPTMTNVTGTAIPAGESVWYRTALGRYVGKRLILGPPSGKVYFTATGNTGVTVNVRLPTEAVAGDRMLIYRSLSATTPNVELRLLVDIAITSAHVAAGFIAYDDHTPNTDLSGGALYTNSTQQGIALANYRPPFSSDVTTFGGMTFYAGARQPHRLTADVFRFNQPIDGIWTDEITGDFTSGSAVITNVAAIDWTGLRAGQYITDEATRNPEVAGTNIPANTTILSWNQGAATITMSANALANNIGVAHRLGDIVTVAGTKYYASNVASSATRQFITQPAYFAKVVSGSNSTVSCDFEQTYTALYSGGGGYLTFEKLTLADSSFTVTSTSPNAFGFANFSSSGTGTSTADGGGNRLMWSKSLEPEHVPLGYFQDIGEDTSYMRLIPTRDALFILKRDGVWRLTGRTPETITIEPFDPTLSLLSANAAVAADDRAWAWTNRGVVAIGDAGVLEASNTPIGVDFAPYELDMTTDIGSEYAFLAWNPLDREILVGTPDGAYLYIFNLTTAAWTRWIIPVSSPSGATQKALCATVFEDDAKLYIGTDVGNVRQELKEPDINGIELYDASQSVTISTVGSTTLTLSGAVTIGKGAVIRRSSTQTYLTADVTSSAVLPVASTSGFTTGAATLYTPFECGLGIRDRTGRNPGLQKLYRETMFFYGNVSTAAEFSAPGGTLTYTSSRNTSDPITTSEVSSLRGFQRVGVPRSVARTNRLWAELEIQRVDAHFYYRGAHFIWEPMSERM